MKQYRLLRDNKETGPYSAEELVRKGLKAYDLIWVDGKSASWRYPSEITELRAFAPAAEMPSADRQPQAQPAAATTPAPAQPQPQPTAPARQVPQQAEPAGSKPRFRIKADLHKVEIIPANQQAQEYTAAAAAAKAPTPAAVPQTAAASDATMGVGWEEAYSEWRTDNKGNVIHQAQTEEPAEATVKYSASLDDIKQRYEETVLNPRRRLEGSQWVRYGIGFLMIPLLGVAIWLGKKWDNKQTAEALHRPLTEEGADKPSVLSGADLKASDEPASSQLKNAGAAATKTKTAKTGQPTATHTTDANTAAKNTSTVPPNHTTAAVKTTPAQKPAGLPKTTVVKPPVTTAANKPVTAPVTKPGTSSSSVTAASGNTDKVPVVPAVVKESKPQTLPANNTTPAANTTAANVPKTQAPAATAPATTPVNTAPVAAKKRIADYVAVNDEYAVPGNNASMRLHVKNLSAMPVDLVVLDVQYYDAKGRFQKGETMYVNHLGAKDEVALEPPAAKTAQKVTYKVSLLSIEKKGIYLIAE
ncbi:hypothetical protein [Deminuibacter soli]|uniref:DUF4339 domain-containing protein n=1 Tax=Deminuibacter soli TaxID=2291815 RepID=A0A3E1NJT6_9BACT|nr:hypothetical protein [Deminuibacter soli]RFM28094.1 hypothetical protein DXN05_11210 [Deminuibacter soli]